MSRRYQIEIEYRLDGPPRTRILSPVLRTREGERLPHVFRNGTLCLYFKEDWTSSMFLADTVLPWAAEWLLHYEVWLATGSWRGQGIHPTKTKSLRAESERT